jgi:hypothetical protein
MHGSSQPEYETARQERAPDQTTNYPTKLPHNLARLLHRAGTGLAIGVLAAGAFADSTENASAVAVSEASVVPATLYTPLPTVETGSAAKNNKPTNETHEELNDKNCTSLRRRAKDIYMGIACAEDGAEAETVFSSTLEKGWVYSAVNVGGYYKCAFIMAGVLPEMEHHPKIVSKCEDFYDSLVLQRYEYFKDYNCKEIKPGLEGCRSATPPREINDECQEVPVLYGNFATDDPTPFNVLGTGTGGFSMVLPNEINSALGYRVQVRQGSEDGKAIVVRDTNNTASLDWGFTLNCFIPSSKRRGGTPTIG